MSRVQRWGRKFTWPAVLVSQFLPIPTAIIYAVAGWAGMRLVTFLILDAIGSLAWAGMLAGLGWELGHHAVVVAQKISHYGLWVTIALVVVIVFFQVRSQRRMIRTAAQARAAAATAGTASRDRRHRRPAAAPPPPPPEAMRPAADPSAAALANSAVVLPSRLDCAVFEARTVSETSARMTR